MLGQSLNSGSRTPIAVAVVAISTFPSSGVVVAVQRRPATSTCTASWCTIDGPVQRAQVPVLETLLISISVFEVAQFRLRLAVIAASTARVRQHREDLKNGKASPCRASC